MELMKILSEHLESRLLELKELSDRGTKIVGYVPNGYMPEELVYASGAVPVALALGGDPNAVAVSASCLGTFIDTFCRAQLGYRILGTDPFYQILDLFVIPITDIHIRTIAESWDFFTDVELFTLPVPHAKTDRGLKYYLEGVRLLKKRLEGIGGTEIAEQKLREDVYKANKVRSLLREISLMRRSQYPPMSGRDFIKLNHYSLYADRHTIVEVMESLREELKAKEAPRPAGPRILLTGSTLAMGDYKVVDLLEETGASIVIEEFSEGMRNYWQNVDRNEDPVYALADNYFTGTIPGAFFRGAAKERYDFLLKLAKDFAVEGVVWYSLMYRETYDIEGYLFSWMLETSGIPMLRIKSNYDAGETGPLRTRIEAFIETLGRR